MARHPSTEHIMQFFSSGHLQARFQEVAQPCESVAYMMLNLIPEDNPELTAGLRKLLEAKDCFVRARLASEKEE